MIFGAISTMNSYGLVVHIAPAGAFLMRRETS
jgi:hypothetical protein